MRTEALVCITVCSVALTLSPGVGSSGWRPIPSPRGVFHSKASSEPIFYKPHPQDEFRSTILDSPRIGGEASSDLFYNSPSHAYKYTTDLKSHDLETVFKKEPSKSYKPVLLSYEDTKRPTFSYNNFNSFRPNKKPVKTGFYEKPEIVYTDFVKHEENHAKHASYIDNEIRPHGGYLGSHEDRQCSLYKVAFRQDLYFQYIQYKVAVPDLKEFTLCLWSKYSNHTNDHPLFSYAVRNQPKALSVWVSTTDRSNYFNMAINNHPILRLNYPIRLNRWYHTCTSWNGKTGEWQVWVNAERIGRGYHNLLVNHVIPGGGIAITGQEQRQLGGGFLEGPDAPKGSGGFLGEVTMLQLYKVALTAGKAYNDHRTHHSLQASTTPPPPPPPPTPSEPPMPEHPFLENGQLKKKIPVFELAEAIRPKLMEQGQPPLQAALPVQGGLDLFNNPFASGFYSSGLDSAPVLSPFMMQFTDHNLFKRNNDKNEDTRSKRNGDQSVTNPGENADMKVKFLPTPQRVHVEKVKFGVDQNPQPTSDAIQEVEEEDKRQKREYILVDESKEEPEESERDGKSLKRPARQNIFGNYGVRPQRSRRPFNAMRKQEADTASEGTELDPTKRQVPFGDFGFNAALPSRIRPALPHEEEESEGPKDPMEPAEGEVRRIMNVCSGCEADPFRKVAVISWRSAPKKIYSGALFIKARAECRRF